ncbi:MAG: transporter substrate-binding domain-containing protein [Nitrospirae bacterium]|nr:transporter substrate-binding domain-containing protein [Nitrospirota bacterium]
MRKCFLINLYLIALLFPTSAAFAEIPPEPKSDHTETIRAIVQSDSPPTYFKDRATGEASGFAVDVMNQIAKRGGFSVTYQFEKNWDAIAPLLKDGKADVAPGQGITENRKGIFDFTIPIGTFPVSIFARANNSLIKDLKDVKVIGVTKGSSSSEILKNKNTNLIISTYESNANGLMDLLSGNIDAFCTSATTLMQIALDAGLEEKITIIGDPLSEVKRAIAVRKDAPELLNKLNKLIEEFSHTAEYKALYSKWYGKPKPYWTDKKVLIVISAVVFLIVAFMAVWRYRSLVVLNRNMQENINEREKAEVALLEQENFSKNLIQNSATATFVLDRTHRIMLWNKSCEKLTGCKEFDMIGTDDQWKPFYDHKRPTVADVIINHDADEILQKLYKNYAKSSLNPEGITAEGWYKNLGGKDRYIIFEAAPIFNNKGELIAAIETLQDITELKRLEEQLRQSQKLDAIGQLAGGVAHDFNNIITAIVGYSHLTLMKLDTDSPLKANIEQILQASDRATTLNQSLLAFSRKQVINPKPNNLNDIVSGMQKFLLRLIREDIDIKINCANEDLTIMADRGQIEQIMMNLVTNARDAMSKGGHISIKTELMQIDQDFIEAHGYGRIGRYALLMISDTGSGMDAKTKEKIFEPFFTTKEQGKGTGLGLSMVYGIVSQHEGYIDVYSEIEKGTVFKIYIPIFSGGIEAEPTEKELISIKGGNETILVAEDDSVLRMLSAKVLANYGYKVIEAVDGEDAISKYAEHSDTVKLVILDGIMPKKNGRQAYEEIRIINSRIKALFFSGYAEDILSKEGLLEPGINFILKPVAPSVLLKKVRELLDA